MTQEDIARAYEMVRSDPGVVLSEVYRDAVFIHTPRKTVTARNVAQKAYLDALRRCAMVFAVGPAGTGKTYLAVVHGEPDALQGTYRDLLRRDPNERKTYVTDKMAKGVQEAVLDYEVLGTRAELSLVRIYLQTGRTHQIRVQFASRGLPLLGDGKYGSRCGRCTCALWSYRLSFPDGKGEAAFEAQPPAQFPWTVFF